MTLKQEAQNLVNSFKPFADNTSLTSHFINDENWHIRNCKECAKILVKRMIDEYQNISDLKSILFINDKKTNVVDRIEYYKNLLKKIEKL